MQPTLYSQSLVTQFSHRCEQLLFSVFPLFSLCQTPLSVLFFSSPPPPHPPPAQPPCSLSPPGSRKPLTELWLWPEPVCPHEVNPACCESLTRDLSTTRSATLTSPPPTPPPVLSLSHLSLSTLPKYPPRIQTCTGNAGLRGGLWDQNIITSSSLTLSPTLGGTRGYFIPPPPNITTTTPSHTPHNPPAPPPTPTHPPTHPVPLRLSNCPP